jgi:activator of HSP90 ATPase
MMIKTANIFQVVHVKARPSEVYEMLMDAEKHSAFTQKTATIDPREGGEFAFCNNNHTGHFMRIIKNKRIVLAWTQRKFPRHHFSIVDLQFERNENGGTQISLNHIGVPESCDGWLTEAWRKTYWTPLSEYIEESLEVLEG